jgi:anti-sigma regulatory factor (Ser/Thr protein kinase)
VEDVFNLTQATDEAAANAIEHVYRARQGVVTVAPEKLENGACIATEDSGRWRAWQARDAGEGLGSRARLVTASKYSAHDGLG